jgi:cell division protease FtsH
LGRSEKQVDEDDSKDYGSLFQTPETPETPEKDLPNLHIGQVGPSGFGGFSHVGGFSHGREPMNIGAMGQKKEKSVWNRYDPNEITKKIYLRDIIGQDVAKEKVGEALAFLKKPAVFRKFNAKMPKGILFYGPPGTGKTLLAKAIASEAGVPMYTVSGSSFVQVFVGKGAERIRDLFAQARKDRCAIIFIDEFDSLAPIRNNNKNNDERESTLNELLKEMDGFEGKDDNILIIAATNRKDMLDPAVLRPGRLNEHVKFNLPSTEERVRLLKSSLSKKPVDPKIDLNKICEDFAEIIPGDKSHSHVVELVEKAARKAAMENINDNKNDNESEEYIKFRHLSEACDEIILGNKNNRKREVENLRHTAYHEIGHTVVALKSGKEIYKTTIAPRGDAAGVMIGKEKHEYASDYTKEEFENEISVLFAGRLAEEMFCSSVKPGAKNDLDRANNLAENMVEWGMGTLMKNRVKSKNDSKKLQEKFDQDKEEILERCENRAKEILKNNSDLVHKLADALLKETELSAERINEIAG